MANRLIIFIVNEVSEFFTESCTSHPDCPGISAVKRISLLCWMIVITVKLSNE